MRPPPVLTTAAPPALMTTLCASFLAWKLRSHNADHAVSTAYAWAFFLLCGLHAFTFFSAIQLPRRLDDVAIRE